MAFNDATIVTASDVVWSSGDKFNGFLLMLLAPPVGRTSVYLKDSQRLRVPLDVKIPIREGVVASKQKVWQTGDLEPPNCQYCDLWYDDTLVQVVAGASLFTITSSEHTITPPTLTVPAAASTKPDPSIPLTDDAVLGVDLNLAAQLNVETASGSGSSVTITSTPQKIIGLYWNGQRLVQGVDYTVTASTINFTSISVGANEVLVVYV